jgi:hypothetical protein
MHSTAGAKYHSVVLLEPPGNSAITNSVYASAITSLPIVNLDVQEQIGSSSLPMSAADVPSTVLPPVRATSRLTFRAHPCHCS